MGQGWVLLPLPLQGRFSCLQDKNSLKKLNRAHMLCQHGVQASTGRCPALDAYLWATGRCLTL